MKYILKISALFMGICISPVIQTIPEYDSCAQDVYNGLKEQKGIYARTHYVEFMKHCKDHKKAKTECYTILDEVSRVAEKDNNMEVIEKVGSIKGYLNRRWYEKSIPVALTTFFVTGFLFAAGEVIKNQR